MRIQNNYNALPILTFQFTIPFETFSWTEKHSWFGKSLK